MDSATTSNQKRHRSPNYPAFSLKEAIDKIKVIYDKERRSSTTPEVIATHLGYSQGIGGPGGRALSALRQYGLIEDTGGQARISDSAYTLTQFPTDSPEWIHALKTTIRKPTLFKELLDEYKDSIPSDATLKHNLLKRDFNPAMIDVVIKSFRDTIALDSTKNVEYPSILVGDYVQWESQGANQFESPHRITRFSEDSKYAFFDGSNTGVPVEQLIKSTPPEERDGSGKPIIRRVPPKPGMNSEVFTLTEGEVVLQWPSKLSPESYEDFKDWLDLISRKAKRVAEKKDPNELPE